MSESKRGEAESAEDFAEKNRMVCCGEGGMAVMGYSFQSMETPRFSPRSPRLSVSLNTDFDLGEYDFAHVVIGRTTRSKVESASRNGARRIRILSRKNGWKFPEASPILRPMAVTTQSYQRLEEEVLLLPRVDRSQLASRLLESLDEEEHELSPEWRDELQRRIGNIDSGTAKLIPAEDLWKEAEQRFGATV